MFTAFCTGMETTACKRGCDIQIGIGPHPEYGEICIQTSNPRYGLKLQRYSGYRLSLVGPGTDLEPIFLSYLYWRILQSGFKEFKGVLLAYSTTGKSKRSVLYILSGRHRLFTL